MPTTDEIGLSPLLMVVNGSLRGASFRLTSGSTVIGRGEGADILVEDHRVSRRHATVQVVDGRVLLSDAGSTNGTWLNDQRVSDPREVRDGDRIRLGGVELRFFDPGSAQTDPVGTLRYQSAARTMLPGPPGAGAVSAALRAPTQALPSRRPRRLLLTIGCCVVLAGWLAWAYLIF
ncbi:hypothetical protein GCM10027290_43220 [Micromonospora sonneratiae]|uniref:FHA domain-containing protein n=1 Tax=Micromonospora sonneratiae TaxID=1184706 RepID=A0ABW3YJB5_9ACTN